jgi:hypothetical protein
VLRTITNENSPRSDSLLSGSQILGGGTGVGGGDNDRARGRGKHHWTDGLSEIGEEKEEEGREEKEGGGVVQYTYHA